MTLCGFQKVNSCPFFLKDGRVKKYNHLNFQLMNQVYPGTPNSTVSQFFKDYPSYTTEKDTVLNHKSAARQFSLLHHVASQNVYTYENVLQSKSGPVVQPGSCFSLLQY